MIRETVSVHWTLLQKDWNGVIDTAGGCMGCLLIDRGVLERYEFESDDKVPPDTPFMLWCQKNNIKQKADLSIICGHKRPNGDIIYPDFKSDYKVEYGHNKT
jgi:hypothetical protein